MLTNSFSRVVSGAEVVSNAFDSHKAARLWWRAILWLHGKPTAPTLNADARRQIVADGFRFYAWLYRSLGILFWMVGGALWSTGVFETVCEASYWLGAATLSGGFLWFASGLGFGGAQALREQKGSGRLLLCVFMVAVIAFLSALTAVLSVVVQLQTEYNPILNLCLTSAVWAFGLGSYLIEILYLVVETRLETRDVPVVYAP